ncbi:unnamed protein product [Caenorhabditis brenneri]
MISHIKNGTSWKTILILGLYTLIVLVCWEICESSSIVLKIISSHRSRENQNFKKNVMIYAANSYYGTPINSDLVLGTCPEVKNFCHVTTNSSDAPHADAFIFHNRNFYEVAPRIQFLNSIRKPNVPWILWSIESPSHDRFPGEKDMFNWTMTYRKDADLWAPYGFLVKRNTSINYDLNPIWSLKNKTATWLGSNCQTPNNRIYLIKHMIHRGLKADVWGACGSPPGVCDGVLKQQEPCVLELIRPYKFYLAIENSNCKDYVTEKFWKSLDDRMAVPIVLIRETVRELGVLNSAYISVDDFGNLKEFVDYVNKMSNDKELYLKYHEWRRDYEVVFDNGFGGWCDLCKRLQNLQEIQENRKSYGDIDRWHSFKMCDDSLTMKYLS